MVDTCNPANDNTKEISTSAHSSVHYESESEKNEELQRAIASGKKLIRVLEEQDKINLQERDLKEFLETKYEDIVPSKDAAVVVNSLMHVLNETVRQNQQLRLKNMILKSNSGDVQSRYEVEENLKKQQFERMKCQLFLERENLLKKLEIKDGKVVKYKNKIIGKNREINRLMRILNEHSISNTGKINHTSSNSDNSDNYNSVSSGPKHVTNSEAATSKTSGMLKTLGVLASQVLNDEVVDEDSANQTIIQANNSSNSKGPIECNTTEPEILHSPNITAAIPNPEPLSEQSSQSLSRITETGNQGNFLKSLPTQLPKMKRFSTVDGTVKDIE